MGVISSRPDIMSELQPYLSRLQEVEKVLGKVRDSTEQLHSLEGKVRTLDNTAAGDAASSLRESIHDSRTQLQSAVAQMTDSAREANQKMDELSHTTSERLGAVGESHLNAVTALRQDMQELQEQVASGKVMYNSLEAEVKTARAEINSADHAASTRVSELNEEIHRLGFAQETLLEETRARLGAAEVLTTSIDERLASLYEEQVMSAKALAKLRQETLTSQAGMAEAVEVHHSLTEGIEVRLRESLLGLQEKSATHEDTMAELRRKVEGNATEVKEAQRSSRNKQDLLNMYGLDSLPAEVTDRLNEADTNGDEELSVKEFLENRSRGGKKRREWKSKVY